MPPFVTAGPSISARPKRALFLLRYSSLAASTRVRLLQYRPYLEANGWSVDTHAFWDDSFLKRLYSQGTRSAWRYGAALLQRVSFLLRTDLRQYDAIVAHQDVLPWLPFVVENACFRGAKGFVLDLDDAAYVSYQNYPWLRNKYAALFRYMSEINVGNETLAAYASQFNDRVNIIPTVVDTNRYQVREYQDWGEVPVVGWIGTPITSRYLLPFAEALRAVAIQQPFRFRCVGVQPDFSLPGVSIEPVAWSEETECSTIRTFDVGIMPLANEEFAKGKCGYKLVQYMACGVPALGTAMGANNQIITHEVNGLLAPDAQSFGTQLLRLLRDRDLRLRLGAEGRHAVESRFSLKSQEPRVLASLERAMRPKSALVPSGRVATT